MRWINAKKRKPEIENGTCESDYVLCIENNGQPYSGWWNETSQNWYSADRDAPTLGRVPTFWRPMIKLPKGF